MGRKDGKAVKMCIRDSDITKQNIAIKQSIAGRILFIFYWYNNR